MKLKGCYMFKKYKFPVVNTWFYFNKYGKVFLRKFPSEKNLSESIVNKRKCFQHSVLQKF